MNVILTLFILGLVLLSLEVFLPGGVLGVLGGIAMIAAVVLTFRQHGTTWGAVAVCAALLLSVGTVVAEFVILPKTKIGRRLFLSETISGVAPAGRPESLVGRQCEAVTPLAPSGLVLLDGQKHEAFCRDGFAERGARLYVRGQDNFRLIVSKS